MPRRRLGFGLTAAAALAAAVLLVATPPALEASRPSLPTEQLQEHPSDDTEVLIPPRVLSDKARLRAAEVAGRNFTYCGNGSLDAIPAQVDRVVFAVHGNDRNACSAATAVLNAGTPEQRERTLVVAPRFVSLSDTVNPLTDWVWSPSNWSQGDLALGSTRAESSSFEVLNALVDRAGTRERLVVGFSGGGQFVNRYAATTTRPVRRFVVINPSTYLYFTPERPGVPGEILAACPAYDDYRYGVQKLPPQVAGLGAQGLRQRYAKAPVTYLLGDADNNPRDASLDKSCGARSQGAQRFERGQRYWDYLPTV